MRRAHLKYGIDIGLIVTFTLCFFTGIVKLPALLQVTGLTQHLGRYRDVTMVHDASGVVMGLLVLAHLVLNWPWIVAMTGQIFRRKSG
jgi:cytochrome bd-type quinol oxidase subunit 1